MFFGDMQTRLLTRLGEDPTNPQYYTAADAAAWLNATQRLFVFLTLCLETQGTLNLQPNIAFYSMLPVFADWLLPLRVRLVSGGGAENVGAKLTQSRLSDLAALDSAWSQSPGSPIKYALLGFDLLAVYQQMPVGPIAMSLSITYARCPDLLVNSFDTPEIPAEYHPALIDGAEPLMRVREGAQEMQKVMPLWDRFLDAATKLADYVRARNKEQGYDQMPVELRRFDRSKLLMQQANSAKQ